MNRLLIDTNVYSACPATSAMLTPAYKDYTPQKSCPKYQEP